VAVFAAVGRLHRRHEVVHENSCLGGWRKLKKDEEVPAFIEVTYLPFSYCEEMVPKSEMSYTRGRDWVERDLQRQPGECV